MQRKKKTWLLLYLSIIYSLKCNLDFRLSSSRKKKKTLTIEWNFHLHMTSFGTCNKSMGGKQRFRHSSLRCNTITPICLIWIIIFTRKILIFVKVFIFINFDILKWNTYHFLITSLSSLCLRTYFFYWKLQSSPINSPITKYIYHDRSIITIIF